MKRFQRRNVKLSLNVARAVAETALGHALAPKTAPDYRALSRSSRESTFSLAFGSTAKSSPKK